MLAFLLLTLQAVPSDPLVTDAPGMRIEHALVVHADNPEANLSSERLRRIFRAEVREWSSKNTIKLLLPRTGTSSKQALLERLYHMTDRQLKRYWTQLIYENRIVEAPQTVPSPAVALRTTERMRWSLAVVPASEVLDGARVKVVAIDGRMPGDAEYPLWSSAGGVIATEGPGSGAAVRAREASLRIQAEPAPAQDLEDRVAYLEQELAMSKEQSAVPILNFHLFGHAEAEVEKESISGQKDDSGGTFSVESVDFLVTSALTDRWSVLAETVIDAQEDGDYDVELERLLLKYRHSDALQFHGGRFLTSIGYWNTRYHHGEWLQTSIDRPEVLGFEDNDGSLPLHNVGIGIKGGFYTDDLGIDYVLEIANGRAATPDVTQVKVDDNDIKALNVAVAVEPTVTPGLRIGGGIYLDDIPANSDSDAGTVHGSLDETILNVFAAYEDSAWEVMGEYFWIEHDDGTTTAETTGWYVQVGRRMGRWTPYVRLDGLDRDGQDTYWETIEDTFAAAVGVRCDVVEWAALTIQYERADVDMPTGDPDETTDTLVLQASFAL